MEPWELAAREAIRDLVACYNALGDAGRLDALLALFAEDAVLEFGGRSHRGEAGLRRLFGSVSAISPGTGVRHLRHFTSTLVIELGEPGRATGHCYYQTLTDAGLDHWGRYLDDYVRVDGGWRFARRRVTVDGQVSGGWAERVRARLEGGG